MQTRRPYRSLIAATLALGLTACGQPGATDEPVDIDVGEGQLMSALEADVNDDYGNLDASDEEPNFGDDELASDADLSGDGEVIDDVIDNADDNELLADLEADEESGSLAIRPRKVVIAVVWGHLRRGAPETPTDFSGSLSIENGALRVLRTLGFEGQDAIERPRSSMQQVAFTSHTLPHVDGLLVQAIMHPRLGTGVNGPAVITLDTEAYTGSLTLRPGMLGNKVVPVDEAGNAVAYHAFLPDADGCANGLMAGRWRKVEDTADSRVLGRIKGHYISSDGHVRGKLRGVYGQRVNGSRVFFAKVIGHDGEFKGTLAGKYREGRYRGRFLDTDHEVKGAVFGRYREAPAGERGGFRGRFSERCGELPTEGTIEPHDEYNDELDDVIDELEDIDNGGDEDGIDAD